MNDDTRNWLLGSFGAVTGGVLGVLVVSLWLGEVGLVIPGLLVGLGCRWLARKESSLRGLACALFAFGLAVFTEMPFRERPFFEMGLLTWLMIAFGCLLAFWFGRQGSLGTECAPPPEHVSAIRRMGLLGAVVGFFGGFFVVSGRAPWSAFPRGPDGGGWDLVISCFVGLVSACVGGIVGDIAGGVFLSRKDNPRWAIVGVIVFVVAALSLVFLR